MATLLLLSSVPAVPQNPDSPQPTLSPPTHSVNLAAKNQAEAQQTAKAILAPLSHVDRASERRLCALWVEKQRASSWADACAEHAGRVRLVRGGL